jgi:hypothetical protein
MELTRPTSAERAVYDDLRSNQLGPAVRLEQERVRFVDLERAVRQTSANHGAISIT